GLVGGLITLWLGEDFLASRLGLPAASSEPGEDIVPQWLSWAVAAAAFAPGALVGGLAGLFIIRPVNAILGWLFRGFNHGFDQMTHLYGRLVGGLLRISMIVILVYGGLLVLTYWQFIRTPTGFIPQQDKGYLLLNVQLPDSA